MIRRSIVLAGLLALVSLCSLVSPSVAQADPSTRATDAQLRAAVERHRVRLTSVMKPELLAKVVAAAKVLNQRLDARQPANAKPLDAFAIAKSLVTSTQYFPNAGNYSSGDIEALCSIVMLESAKIAQDELASTKARIKTINDAKACQASSQTRAGFFVCLDGIPLTTALIKATIAEIKSSVDSMNEFGETASLRLQMAMDRLSKVMTTLSNIMKKISDTDSSTVQNLK